MIHDPEAGGRSHTNPNALTKDPVCGMTVDPSQAAAHVGEGRPAGHCAGQAT